jgi:diketogulonate reductase-like aldo/keto reductase
MTKGPVSGRPLTYLDIPRATARSHCPRHARRRPASPPLECVRRLGLPVLGDPRVTAIAARLGRTPAQVALAWLLSLRPNILLIPGTSSVSHLEENIAVRDIALDAAAREALASPR